MRTNHDYDRWAVDFQVYPPPAGVAQAAMNTDRSPGQGVDFFYTQELMPLSKVLPMNETDLRWNLSQIPFLRRS